MKLVHREKIQRTGKCESDKNKKKKVRLNRFIKLTLHFPPLIGVGQFYLSIFERKMSFDGRMSLLFWRENCEERALNLKCWINVPLLWAAAKHHQN